MYGRAKGIEVDSSFWSNPFQNLQASSKAYGFLDVYEDI